LGLEGVRLFLQETEDLPYHFYFTAPSCVPSNPELEAPGASLDLRDVKMLLEEERVVGLGEVMDVKGALEGQIDLLMKIEDALRRGKRVDGHAPGLRGEALSRYISLGISSDHECLTGEEALEKVSKGMRVILRGATMSPNLEVIGRLVARGRMRSRDLLLATDDIEPRMLSLSHMDGVVKAAISLGVDPLEAVQMATVNTARHYHLEEEIGSIKTGLWGDIVLAESLEGMEIRRVLSKGVIAVEDSCLSLDLPSFKPPPIALETVKIYPCLMAQDLSVRAPIERGRARVHVIEAEDRSLTTGWSLGEVGVEGHILLSDPRGDILHIAVLDRHSGVKRVGASFIRGFGLGRGSMASTVAHDSHNLVVVGASLRDMIYAVEALERVGGGMVVVDGGRVLALAEMPYGGIIGLDSVEVMAGKMDRLTEAIRGLGCTFTEPFTTLSFMTLPVIPSLKVTSKGLVDVESFKIIDPVQAYLREGDQCEGEGG
jgi:adenine deaminase